MAVGAKSALESITFADCDREPIHIPGTIQPHGALLILNRDGYVNQCSANVGELLGVTVEQALGSSLDKLVGVDAGLLISTTVSNERLEDNPVFLDRALINEKWFNIIVHKRDDLTLLELELVNEGSSVLVSGVYPAFSRSVANLQQRLSLVELLDTGAREIQKLTSFDRVLIYQFGPDWAGTVVAEARTDRLPSYMDLRFPESDIPRQARELYRLNRTRLIADANYRPVPIVPVDNPITGKTPDLTYSALRSVSPVHLEYLKNMGTAASMSISIIRDGELWGLIACHHHTPARVPVQIRFACELIAQVLSSQLAAAGEHEASALRAQLAASQQRLLEQLSAAESFVDTIVANTDDMLHCVRANGAAVVFQDRCEVMGRTPGPDQVRELADWLSGQPEKDVFVTGELSKKYPPGESYRQVASGLLAVSISEIDVGYLFWFRPDKSAEVRWAGNPTKIEVAIDGQFHPRKSFQTWTERE